jgi:hypothetical protein
LSTEEQPKALLASEVSIAPNALVPTGVLPSPGSSWGVSTAGPFDGKTRQGSSPESAGDMFARWESEGVDAENVVRDALRAGRVPLAVVQLTRIRSRALMYFRMYRKSAEELFTNCCARYVIAFDILGAERRHHFFVWCFIQYEASFTDL